MDNDDKKDTPVADKLPDNPPPTPPDKPADDPAPPAEDNTLRDTVARLEETVNGLAQQVAALAPLPGDETPTSRPWTHKRL
jgi:hypothetical protein